MSVHVRVCKYDFHSICWVRAWQGSTGGILFEGSHTHTRTHTPNIVMQLTDADLVHGQVPGLSALDTHTHAHTKMPTYSGLVSGCHLGLRGYMCAILRWVHWWIKVHLMRKIMMVTVTQTAKNAFQLHALCHCTTSWNTWVYQMLPYNYPFIDHWGWSLVGNLYKTVWCYIRGITEVIFDEIKVILNTCKHMLLKVPVSFIFRLIV